MRSTIKCDIIGTENILTKSFCGGGFYEDKSYLYFWGGNV